MKLLQEFYFDMEYVKGKENVIVDVLFKRPLANAISCIINSLIDEIEIYYVNHDFFKNPFESLARIIDEIDRFESFALKNGVLYYINARVYISKFGEYRLNIMNDLHNIPIANHIDFKRFLWQSNIIIIG